MSIENVFILYGSIAILVYIFYRILAKLMSHSYIDECDEFLICVGALLWIISLPLFIAYITLKAIGVGVDMIVDLISEEISHRKRKTKQNTGNLDNL